MAGLLSLLGGQQDSQGGGLSDLLSAIGPAVAMIDPRNQSLGAGLMQANMNRQKDRRQQQNVNQTASWLQSQGLGAGEAAYLAGDPDALGAWYKAKKAGEQPDWKLQEIYDDQGRKQKVMMDMKSGKYNPIGGAEASSAKETYGNSPVWGQDEKGNWVVMQPSSAGGLRAADVPPGVKLSPPGVTSLNLGTEFGNRDRNGNIISTVPIDNTGKASDTAVGTAQGNLKATLPTDIQQSSQTVKDIDALLTNPGLDSIVGWADQYRGPLTLGGEGRDALTRFKQLQGKAFLQAYGMLRGGGAITEVEGQKAGDAMARMDRSQDETTFRAALKDFRDAVTEGQKKLLQKAGIPQDQWGQYIGGDTAAPDASTAAPAPKTAPTVGDVRYGYRFKGGDPSEPSNWEKAQ